MKTLTPSTKSFIRGLLTTLFSIIFIIPSYSQQNSKFLPIASNALNDHNLFGQQMEAVMEKFRNNIVDGLIEYKVQSGEVDKLIKVIDHGVRVFDQSPDTILFYFRNKKLYRCAFHFFLTSKNAHDLYTAIAYKFGNTITTADDGWNGPYWRDETSEMTLFYNDKNHDEIRLQFDTTVAKESTTVQVVDNTDLLQAPIKINRSGIGHSTFRLNVPTLERILAAKYTLKSVQNSFGQWYSFGADNSVGFEYNGKTNALDIPLYIVYYESTIGGKGYGFRIEIPHKLSNPIKYFEVIYELNGIQLAQLQKSLSENGYLFNEHLSYILQKRIFQNPKKKYMVSIKSNSNSTYSIGIEHYL